MWVTSQINQKAWVTEDLRGKLTDQNARFNHPLCMVQRWWQRSCNTEHEEACGWRLHERRFDWIQGGANRMVQRETQMDPKGSSNQPGRTITRMGSLRCERPELVRETITKRVRCREMDQNDYVLARRMRARAWKR